jgi:hypothetical protein
VSDPSTAPPDGQPRPADTPHEGVDSLAAAWDEVLTDGAGEGPDVPGELRSRIEKGLACARLLRRHWGEPPDTAEYEGSSAAPAAAAEHPVQCLGRFEVRGVLGSGGFGIVYLAYDPLLGREVALKLPRPQALLTPELRQRFQQEARAAAGLDHPYLVPVYEAGEIGPFCYIASAYCPGPTLASWLRDHGEPAPARAAADLVRRLAEGVEHAHQRGVVHRDLKPANVLLTVGGRGPVGDPAAPHAPLVPRITDFGLAKCPGSGEPGLTASHTILGTANYMAPEQAAGDKGVGPACDVWALGAILYELLTGRPPFLGATQLDTLDQVRSQEPVPPARLQPKCPRDLETVCLKCLRKEPRQRYAGAGELAADLGRFLAGEPVRARPVGRPERLARWGRRHPAVAGLLAALALALAAGFGGVTWKWLEADAAAGARAAALRQEEEERRRKEEALGKAEASLYLLSITQADRDWQEDRVARAEQLLDACPPGLRGWEWDYLKRLCNSHRLTFAGHAAPVCCVAYAAAGRLAASGDSRGGVCLWDAKTGRQVRAFALRNRNSVSGVALSADGGLVIATCTHPQ